LEIIPNITHSLFRKFLSWYQEFYHRKVLKKDQVYSSIFSDSSHQIAECENLIGRKETTCHFWLGIPRLFSLAIDKFYVFWLYNFVLGALMKMRSFKKSALNIFLVKRLVKTFQGSIWNNDIFCEKIVWKIFSAFLRERHTKMEKRNTKKPFKNLSLCDLSSKVNFWSKTNINHKCER